MGFAYSSEIYYYFYEFLKCSSARQEMPLKLVGKCRQYLRLSMKKIDHKPQILIFCIKQEELRTVPHKTDSWHSDDTYTWKVFEVSFSKNAQVC